MADEILLKVAIELEPLRVASEMGYDVHRLSPKDIVDKGDYEAGYRFRLSKPDPSKPFPETVMARSESEVATFLKREIGTGGNPTPEAPTYYHSTEVKGEITKFKTSEVWFDTQPRFYGERDIIIDYKWSKPFITNREMVEFYDEWGFTSREEAERQISENRKKYIELGGESNPASFQWMREQGYDLLVDEEGYAALYPDRVIVLDQGLKPFAEKTPKPTLSPAEEEGNPVPEVEVPKAVVRYKRNYGVGRSVYFVEYEYNGERYITGTIIRGTNRSLGWYFGKGPEGLKEANRIVLLSDEEFDKAEYLPQHSWERQKEKLKARPPVAEPSNPAPEVTPGFYVLKPISAEAKDWVTILSEDYKRTPEGNILVRPSDMEQIGKLIREDYLDITKDFTVARPRTAGNPDAKEPWQMTRAEHLEAARTWRQEYMPRLKGQALEDELRKVDEGHRRTVEYALAKGRPVPPEVLAEYPDLEARYGPEEIHLGEKMIVVPIEKPIIDLRGDYDEIAHVKDGILYRKGNINQVWWDKWGKETWTAPDERQARENFDAMKERWSPSFHPQTTPDEVEPKRYIIKQEPEPLYKYGKKYVAYYEDGTPRYLAAETEQELKTRLLEAEPSAEFVNPPIAEVPEAKEPWQMTKAEYRASQYEAMRDTTINQMSAKSLMEGGEKAIEEGTQWRLDMLAGAHKSYIRKMLAEGKPVPPEVLAEYPDLARKANPPAVEDMGIPKTYVTRLGFRVELPVARALDVLADYEIPVSSGFHGALNDRWTIVFQDSISPKLRRLAEELGFEVGTRPVKGTTRSYIDVSLPGVSVNELGMATDAFDRLAERYIGKARFFDRYGFNVGQKISGQSPIDNPIKEKLGLESNPPFERLGKGEIAKKLLPMPPDSGPPLPRILGLKWPWKE